MNNGAGLQLSSSNATDGYNNSFSGKWRDSSNRVQNSRCDQFILDDTHSKTFHPDGITLDTTPNGTTGDVSGAALDKDLKEHDATVCCDALHNQDLIGKIHGWRCIYQPEHD